MPCGTTRWTSSWPGTPCAGGSRTKAPTAPYELAEGHLVLMMAMLSALMAYLTRGRGDPGAKARILQKIREGPRLGSKVAGWVVANEDKLTRHPFCKRAATSHLCCRPSTPTLWCSDAPYLRPAIGAIRPGRHGRTSLCKTRCAGFDLGRRCSE